MLAIAMTAVISMLRGVNLGGHNRINMQALCSLYESLGLKGVRSHIQSGNVVFATEARDLQPVVHRIEKGIERGFGFRVPVILRTSSEMRNVITRNPFAGRTGIEPARLLVMFLAADPGPAARERVLGVRWNPEEAYLRGSELYIYYPNGVGRSKVSMALLDKTMGTPGTGRNWNTVTKLMEMAEKLEAS